MFVFSIMKCMEISFPDKFNHWEKKKSGREMEPRLLKFVENIRKLALHLKRNFSLFKIF